MGPSGGIILCCRRRVLVIKDSWIGDFSVSALVEDLVNNCNWIVTSVYGPNDRRLSGNFWSELDSIRNRWRGPWFLGGDWNVIRYPSEKSSGSQITSEMAFTDWINSQSLVNLPLGGATFTWSNHQSSPTLSRLDIFLVFSDSLNLFLKDSELALPKPTSDIFPISLDSNCERWGPAPFRFEIVVGRA